MKNIFAITNFIDKARWNSVENYSEINYANSNMYDSLKILTHYIAYVTDRQMPFQRIWNIGGFVFSKLVEEYSTSNQSIEELVTKYYSTDENNKYKIRVIKPDNNEKEDKYEVIPLKKTQNNRWVVGSVEIKKRMVKNLWER